RHTGQSGHRGLRRRGSARLPELGAPPLLPPDRPGRPRGVGLDPLRSAGRARALRERAERAGVQERALCRAHARARERAARVRAAASGPAFRGGAVALLRARAGLAVILGTLGLGACMRDPVEARPTEVRVALVGLVLAGSDSVSILLARVE